MAKARPGQAIQAWNVSTGQRRDARTFAVGGHAVTPLRRQARRSRARLSSAPSSTVLCALAATSPELRERGTHVVIVHGGGPQIAELLEETSAELSAFHEGLRVTDDETMEYVAMALARVNLHLVATLVHAGLASVGLSGADDALLRAEAVGDAVGSHRRARPWSNRALHRRTVGATALRPL